MRDRISSWKRAFEGDEQAVLPTLVNLAWNYASFSTIVEVVRHSPEDPDGSKQLSPLLFDLLIGCYWSNTLLALRRLVDKGPIQGPNGVCSITAIIQDARACRQRLTRKVYVEDIAGLPYNYEVVRGRHWRHMLAQPRGPQHIPRELWYEPSENRHAQFDWLSGTTPGNSTPDDLIREEVFDRLEARMAPLDGAAAHATVHYAHAATEASRNGRVLAQWGQGEAKEALKVLAETAELVGRWFCYSGIGNILPTPQYDQFRFLDRLAPISEERLQQHWDDFDQEVDRWPSIDDQQL